MNSRKPKVGNNCGLIESDAVGSHSEGGPNKGKEPQSHVFERCNNFPHLEIFLAGTGSIGRQSSLNKFLFPLSQPFCCLGDYIAFLRLASGMDIRGSLRQVQGLIAYSQGVDTR